MIYLLALLLPPLALLIPADRRRAIFNLILYVLATGGVRRFSLVMAARARIRPLADLRAPRHSRHQRAAKKDARPGR